MQYPISGEITDEWRREAMVEAAEHLRQTLFLTNAVDVMEPPITWGIAPEHTPGGKTGAHWYAQEALVLCLTYVLGSEKRARRVREVMLDGEDTERCLAYELKEAQDKAVQHAKDLGHDDGANAASRWEQDAIGGRATGDVTAVARRVIKGIDDGDPAVLDALPRPDLSGQWADGLNSERLFEEACQSAELDPDAERERLYDEVIGGYEEGFSEAVTDGVYSYCKFVLPDEEKHDWEYGSEIRRCSKCKVKEAYWDDEAYPNDPCPAVEE